MNQEKIQEMEPHQSRENMLISQINPEPPPKKAFVKPNWLVKLEARMPGFLYVICPQCNLEWSKLTDSGLCYDCDFIKTEEAKKLKVAEFKLMRIFGSIKSMNYYTFQRFKVNENNRSAFEKMSTFDSATDNVYLCGTAGTGKTHLARAAAKVYALAGRNVIVTSPLRMVDYFRTKSDLEKDNHFDEYANCNILLIDDLGISKHTDFALEVLCEVLNRRILQMRNGLIVTSNLTLDKLAGKNLDDRLSSRLAGLCQVFELRGVDFRVNNALRSR